MLGIHFLPLLLLSPREALSPATSQSCQQLVLVSFLLRARRGGEGKHSQRKYLPSPRRAIFVTMLNGHEAGRASEVQELPSSSQTTCRQSQRREVPARGPF